MHATNTSPGKLSCPLNNTSRIMEILFHLPVLLHLLIAFNHPFIIPLFLFLFHSHAHFFFFAQTQCTDVGEVKLFMYVDVPLQLLLVWSVKCVGHCSDVVLIFLHVPKMRKKFVGQLHQPNKVSSVTHVRR